MLQKKYYSHPLLSLQPGLWSILLPQRDHLHEVYARPRRGIYMTHIHVLLKRVWCFTLSPTRLISLALARVVTILSCLTRAVARFFSSALRCTESLPSRRNFHPCLMSFFYIRVHVFFSIYALNLRPCAYVHACACTHVYLRIMLVCPRVCVSCGRGRAG